MNDPINLSKLDRLILINQYTILRKLNNNTPDYDNFIKILEDGYSFHYEDLTKHLRDDVSEEASRFVLEALELYERLFFSYYHLEDKEGIKAGNLFFPGFNRKTESGMLEYARYFCFDLRRFKDIVPRGSSMESSIATSNKYVNMIKAAANFPGEGDFTADQIKQILASGCL